MNRLGFLVAAALCCALLGACGWSTSDSASVDAKAPEDSAPDAGASPKTRAERDAAPQAGPSSEEVGAGETTKPVEDDAFTPPEDWCGTDRMDPRRTMGDWRRASTPGRMKRTFVKRKKKSWVLVTEWGENRKGRFETWQEEAELPGGESGAVDSEQARVWMGRLYAKNEEQVFASALALGAHRVRDAIAVLGQILWRHPGNHARIAAAIGLGQMKDAGAVRVLLDRGRDDHPLVQTAVLEALHRLTGHEMAPPKARLAGFPADDKLRRDGWELHDAWRAWWRQNEDVVREKLSRKK